MALQIVLQIGNTNLFINNEFVPSKSGKTFPTINPSNEEIICQIAEGDKDDVDKAVEAAKKVFRLLTQCNTPLER